MAASLSDAIAEVRVREIARAEAKLAEQLELPPVALDDETKQNLSPFIRFTTTANVRACPALPTTVGAFVLKLSASGASTEQILRQLEAVARLHDSHGLPNPTATAATRAALEREFNFDAPRSWTIPEKEMFQTLPAEVRAAISRREKQRETEVRRLHNQVADIKRLYGTDSKPVTEKETTEMAKWNSPQGSSDMEKDPLVQGKGPFKAPEWRQITPGKLGPAPDLGEEIFDRVEPASQVDGGYAGKLPKSK
jgi:hypothetical protein